MQIKIFSGFLTLSMLVLLIACQSSVTQSMPKEAVIELSNVIVTATGSDEKNVFCSGFALTSEQVADFFEKAKQVTHKIIHDEYEWLPCYVRGNLDYNMRPHKFEIRAGGTASLGESDSDRVMWFACKVCDKLFGG